MKQPQEVLGVKTVGGLKEASTSLAGVSLLVELILAGNNGSWHVVKGKTLRLDEIETKGLNYVANLRNLVLVRRSGVDALSNKWSGLSDLHPGKSA